VLQIGRSLVRSQLVSLEFFIDINSFRSHYGPGVNSATNRNEYQEHFLGGKSGWCLRLTTLPPSCAVVMKSGNLNFLEPSGPLRACNGTAFYNVRYISVKNSQHPFCVNKGRPTRGHLLYYVNLLLNMFQMLIHPSSRACDYLLRCCVGCNDIITAHTTTLHPHLARNSVAS